MSMYGRLPVIRATTPDGKRKKKTLPGFSEDVSSERIRKVVARLGASGKYVTVTGCYDNPFGDDTYLVAEWPEKTDGNPRL